MFRNVSRKNRLLFLVYFLGIILMAMFALILLLPTTHVQARPDALPPVKVLIITMFPPERDAWLRNGHWRVASYPPGSLHIPNTRDADSDGTVWCRTGKDDHTCGNDGLYLMMTGSEKTNAATSMTSVLSDPILSFRGTYFLTTGIAGTPPSEGTLGFVSWARWIVDRDQGTYSSPPPDFGYQAPKPFKDTTAALQLDERLVQQAYHLTSRLKLEDSPEAQAERALYPGQAGRKPFVAMCDTATTDSYLVGQRFSAETAYIASKATKPDAPAKYCTMQEEDSAVAGVLQRFSLMPGGPNYLQCYLNLRSATTFDQPPPNQSVNAFLAAHLRVNDIALTNLTRVADKEINYLLTQPSCSSDAAGPSTRMQKPAMPRFPIVSASAPSGRQKNQAIVHFSSMHHTIKARRTFLGKNIHPGSINAHMGGASRAQEIDATAQINFWPQRAGILIWDDFRRRLRPCSPFSIVSLGAAFPMEHLFRCC